MRGSGSGGGWASVGRREVLRAAGAASAGLALTPAIGRAAGASPRRLRLLNPHTGERFDDVFHDGEAMLAGAGSALDRLMRDHRAGVTMAMEPDLIDLLWRVQERYVRARGERPWMRLHSGYRTAETNAALAAEGAAPASYHLEGRAADISIAGFGIRILANFALAERTGGIGLYWRAGFVHLDTGPHRHWFRR